MTTQNKITFRVIDAPTGAGKTTALIKMINAAQTSADSFNRFLVLTPLLSEVERICNATTCVQPLENKRKHTSKLHALKQLIISGENICCTHTLCELFDSEVKDLLQNGDYHYILIIDEEPTVIVDTIDIQQPKGNAKAANKNIQEVYKLNKQDYKMLRERGFLLIDEYTGRLYWNDELEYNNAGRRGVFEGVRKTFNKLDLYSFNNDERVIAVVNPSIWLCFDEIYISTYRLHNSPFDYYCQLCTALILNITISIAAVRFRQALSLHILKGLKGLLYVMMKNTTLQAKNTHSLCVGLKTTVKRTHLPPVNYTTLCVASCAMVFLKVNLQATIGLPLRHLKVALLVKKSALNAG